MPESDARRVVRAVSECGPSLEDERAPRIPLRQLRMSLVSPPYEEATPLRFIPMRRSRGEIAILEGRGWRKPEDVAELFWHLRLRCGITPVARLPPQTLLHRPDIAARYQAAGACTVIADTEVLYDALWMALSAPVSLERYWLDWVHARESTMPSGIRPALEAIVCSARKGLTLSDLLREQGISARSVRSWDLRAGFPKLTHWATASRLVKAQLRLQTDRDLSVGDVAREHGYSETASLSNEIHRYFGCSAAVARQLLGLDWRLLSWWGRFSR